MDSNNNNKRHEMLIKFASFQYRELMCEDMFCDDCWGLLSRFSCADMKRLEVRNQSNYKKKQSRLLVTCRYCHFMLRHTRMDRHVQYMCRRNITYGDIRLCKCKNFCSDCNMKHYQKHYDTKPLTYEFRRKTCHMNVYMF